MFAPGGLAREFVYGQRPPALGAFFPDYWRFWVHWRQAGAAHVHFWRYPAPATIECTQIGRFGCF
jgi:hypothetical protein